MDEGGTGLAAFLLSVESSHVHNTPVPIWAAGQQDPGKLRALLTLWNAGRRVSVVHSTPLRSLDPYTGAPLVLLHLASSGAGEVERILEVLLPHVVQGGLVIVRHGTEELAMQPGAFRIGSAVCWSKQATAPCAPPAAITAAPPAFSLDVHEFNEDEVLFPWVTCCTILTYEGSPRKISEILKRRPARHVCVLTGPYWKHHEQYQTPYDAIRESVTVGLALAQDAPTLLMLEDDCVLGDVQPRHSESIRQKMEDGTRCAAYSLGTFILEGRAHQDDHVLVLKGMSSHAVVYSKACRARLIQLMQQDPTTFYDILLYNTIGNVWTSNEPLAVQSLQHTENQARGLGGLPPEILAWLATCKDEESAWYVYREAHRAKPDACPHGHMLRMFPGWTDWRQFRDFTP